MYRTEAVGGASSGIGDHPMGKVVGTSGKQEREDGVVAGAAPSVTEIGESGGVQAITPVDAQTAFGMILEYCREVLAKSGTGLAEDAKECIRKIQQTASIQLRAGQGRTPERKSGTQTPVLGRARHAVSSKLVDLGEISKSIVAGLMLTKPERRIKFISAVSVVAPGDEKLLRIALRNLLTHAWKNTSHREETVIELGVVEKRGMRAFFVRDNGLGFDSAEMERLVRKADGNDTIDANEAGLETVVRIVRKHGGTMWVEDRDGEGVSFYFTI